MYGVITFITDFMKVSFRSLKAYFLFKKGEYSKTVPYYYALHSSINETYGWTDRRDILVMRSFYALRAETTETNNVLHVVVTWL